MVALNNQVVVQVLTMGEWLITTSKMMIKLEIEIGISSKISFRFNKKQIVKSDTPNTNSILKINNGKE